MFGMIVEMMLRIKILSWNEWYRRRFVALGKRKSCDGKARKICFYQQKDITNIESENMRAVFIGRIVHLEISNKRS